MTERLRPDEPVTDGIRRVVRADLARVASRLDDPGHGADRGVHDLRKACKRARGVLRMVRPALTKKQYKRENARFRDLANAVGAARGAKVALDRFDELARDLELDRATAARWRGRLEAALRADSDGGAGPGEALDPREALERARPDLTAAYDAAAEWTFTNGDGSDAKGFGVVAGGYRRTYAAARDEWSQLRECTSSERLHEWRKDVKYALYQTEVLRDVWKAEMRARARELKRLAGRLGDEHDWYELRRLLRAAADGDEARDLLRELERRRVALRGACLRAGGRLFADPADDHLAHLRRLWRTWRRHARGKSE